MPTFLGKQYSTELIFINAFSIDTVLPVTSDPTDTAAVQSAVDRQFITMKTLKTKQMKSLLTLSTGVVLLLTTKIVV